MSSFFKPVDRSREHRERANCSLNRGLARAHEVARDERDGNRGTRIEIDAFEVDFFFLRLMERDRLAHLYRVAA
jgi:hypothetical protein